MSASRRRLRRLVARGLLGLVAVLAVGALALGVLAHTAYGRGVIARQLEDRLAGTFVGGATIGDVSGNPLGDLVVHDVVIRGPDGQPAIRIARLVVDVDLLPLLRKRARISELRAEGVRVDVRRDRDGELNLAHLVKPGPGSAWSVDVPAFVIAGGEIVNHGATGVDHVEQLRLTGSLRVPADGPLALAIEGGARWRERDLGLAIAAAVDRSERRTSIATLAARAGALHVAGRGIEIVTAPGRELPDVTGRLSIRAPRGSVARLVRGATLPADLAATIVATARGDTSHVEADARLGGDPLRVVADVELAARHATGTVASSGVTLARWTGGAVAGRARGTARFDLALRDRAFPVGTASLDATARLRGYPATAIKGSIRSTGDRLHAGLDATGDGIAASLGGELAKRGRVVTLAGGRVTARVDAAAAPSLGGEGAIAARLAVSGQLAPALRLDVAGTVDGRALRYQGVAIDRLALAIDARRLPDHPAGRLDLAAERVRRGDVAFREVSVRARGRPDGDVAVAIRTRPAQAPWLVEADAVVTPGDVIRIRLGDHHIHAGDRTDWRGDGGQIAIARDRIAVRELATSSRKGKLAVSGTYFRGARAGDLIARLDATGLAFALVDPTYLGTIDLDLDVARRRGRFTGTAAVDAHGIALDPAAPTIDATARLTARPDALTAEARLDGARLGRGALALDVAPPADLLDAAAWRRLDRGAVRASRLTLDELDVGAIAELAQRSGDYGGRISGELAVSATRIGGALAVRGLEAPALRDAGKLAIDLTLAQPAPGELEPRLVVQTTELGELEADARIALPRRLFDPAAWRALDRGAVRRAAVVAEDVAIDPARLARLGVVPADDTRPTVLGRARGRLAIATEATAGLATGRLRVAIRDLRLAPTARPIELDVVAAIDGRGARGDLEVRAPGDPARTLVDVTASLPVTTAALWSDPEAALARPIDARAELHAAPLPVIAAVFGGRGPTAGVVDGTLAIGGRLRAPTGEAHLVATGVEIPPGVGGTATPPLRRLAIDGAWNGRAGTLALDAIEPAGRLHLIASGAPDALDRAAVKLQATRFDVRPLLAFAPGRLGAVAGQLDADLTLRGLDLVKARLAGTLRLTRARVPIAPEVGTLRRAHIALVAGDRMRVELAGRIGRGTVRGRGELTMRGALPTGGTATLTLRGVSPIGTIEPIVDADAAITLRRGDDAWIADVVVRRGHVDVPEQRGERLDPIGPPPDMVLVTEHGDLPGERGDAGAARPPAKPVIVTHVTITPTFVESKEVRGLVRGKLDITTDGTELGVFGTIEAVRGELDLFARRYDVERAQLRFDGGLDPALDVKLIHEFPSVTTITVLRGRLSKPELVMTANPGTYSQGQLLGFLLGGQPDGTPADARDRAAAAGTSYLANRLGGYVQRALPLDLDVLRYEAGGAQRSSSITVGTWLTRNLFVAYRHRLEARPDENTGQGEIEYWITRRLLLQGTIGDRNYNGADVLWRKRY